MPKPVKTCTNHCRRCGRHFHSTAAFDSHRRGKYQPKKGERGLHCTAPEDMADSNGDDLFIALTDKGWCQISEDRPQMNITIWALREAYENMQNGFNDVRKRKVRT